MSDHYVTLPDGTGWPVNVSDIEWKLRYGMPERTDLLIAASVLSIYSTMTDPRLRDRDAATRLRRARAAQRDAPLPVEEQS